MMDCINYINGTWQTGSNSTVPVYDAGFLLGDGLFETIRFDNRKLFFPEKHLKISPIGHIEKIITFVIHSELKNHIATNSYKDFLINLALDINIPYIVNALSIKIDKRSSTADIKCPICILNYTQFELEKTTLPCGHALCKTCLLNLFKSNIKTCPLCRKNILDDLEESTI